MTPVLLAALALAAPALWAGAAGAPSAAGVGASAAVGSAGFWRATAWGDAEWERLPWTPYGALELGTGRDARRLTVSGGAWRELGGGARAKGGLGFSVGRYAGADTNSSAVTFEAGAERRDAELTWGGDYALTVGALRPSRVEGAVERNRAGKIRAAAASPDSETFTDHDLGVYARRTYAAGVLSLRAALELPSDSGAVLRGTAAWTLPLGAALWLTPGLSFEQGPRACVIASVGAYHPL